MVVHVFISAIFNRCSRPYSAWYVVFALGLLPVALAAASPYPLPRAWAFVLVTAALFGGIHGTMILFKSRAFGQHDDVEPISHTTPRHIEDAS